MHIVLHVISYFFLLVPCRGGALCFFGLYFDNITSVCLSDCVDVEKDLDLH